MLPSFFPTHLSLATLAECFLGKRDYSVFFRGNLHPFSFLCWNNLPEVIFRISGSFSSFNLCSNTLSPERFSLTTFSPSLSPLTAEALSCHPVDLLHPTQGSQKWLLWPSCSYSIPVSYSIPGESSEPGTVPTYSCATHSTEMINTGSTPRKPIDVVPSDLKWKGIQMCAPPSLWSADIQQREPVMWWLLCYWEIRTRGVC